MRLNWNPIHTAPFDKPVLVTDGNEVVCIARKIHHNGIVVWSCQINPDQGGFGHSPPFGWLSLPDPLRGYL